MHWEVGEVALFLLKLGHVASANWLLLIMQDTCQTESNPAITSRDWGTVFCESGASGRDAGRMGFVRVLEATSGASWGLPCVQVMAT